MNTLNAAVAKAPANVVPFFLGRQPILDRNARTVAYELLFRSGAVGGADVTDGRLATASVIAHAFTELGIEAVLGDCRGFINFDAQTLLSDLPEALPPGKVVLEILETVEFSNAVVNRCQQLHAAGFGLALDDLTHISPGHEAVMPLVEVIKIDLHAVPDGQLAAVVEACRRPGVELLAEKVDTQEQADLCRKLGFTYFQGYFFARPVILEGRAVDPSRAVLLELVQQVIGVAEIREVEASFKRSPELSYKLMRLVNSAAMGISNRIESLSHALTMLGARQLSRWLQVLLFAHPSAGTFPTPLLNMAASRGKLMELLAEEISTDTQFMDRAFMTGILSLLDALLGMPMDEILAQIHVSDEVRDALLHRAGRLGQLLQVAETVERSDMNAVRDLATRTTSFDTARLPILQINAMAWANEIERGEAE
jgi:EAL and modified HD-GYP domain-containing signal transduction protein